MRYVIGCILILSFCVGCAQSSNDLEPANRQTKEQIQFSTINNENNINQQPANKAKKIADGFDETTDIYAVNSNDTLLVAFDIKQMHRFQIQSLEKDIKKRLKEDISNFEIEVSTDAKIRLELEELEQNLQHKNVSNQFIEKQMEYIISLSKEET